MFIASMAEACISQSQNYLCIIDTDTSMCKLIWHLITVEYTQRRHKIKSVVVVESSELHTAYAAFDFMDNY